MKHEFLRFPTSKCQKVKQILLTNLQIHLLLATLCNTINKFWVPITFWVFLGLQSYLFQFIGWMIFLKRNIIPSFLCLKSFEENLLMLKLNPKFYLMVHKAIKNTVPASLSNFSSVTHLYSCPMFRAYLPLATPPNVPCFTSHSLYI